MLEVRPEALSYLSRALDARGAPADTAMRLHRGAGELEVILDRERPGDLGYELEDRTVLVIEREFADELAGKQLGVVENPSGQAELHLEHK